MTKRVLRVRLLPKRAHEDTIYKLPRAAEPMKTGSNGREYNDIGEFVKGTRDI